MDGNCGDKGTTSTLQVKSITITPLPILTGHVVGPFTVAARIESSGVEVAGSILYVVVKLPVAGVEVVEVSIAIFVSEMGIAVPIFGSVVNSIVVSV